ncbi:response regulator [Alcaligenaceae bacterium B3P038]|nr:response regulator [Alcaligenaceae bacterium B3P038]
MLVDIRHIGFSPPKFSVNTTSRDRVTADQAFHFIFDFDTPHRTRPIALVVDDEPLLAEPTSDALYELGFNVTTHTLPAAALAWIAVQPKIALIITDVQRPDMNGFELITLARAIHPTVPVVFVSGYAQEFSGRELRLPPQSLFIGKPYSMSDLRRAVGSLS